MFFNRCTRQTFHLFDCGIFRRVHGHVVNLVEWRRSRANVTRHPIRIVSRDVARRDAARCAVEGRPHSAGDFYRPSSFPDTFIYVEVVEDRIGTSLQTCSRINILRRAYVYRFELNQTAIVCSLILKEIFDIKIFTFL